MKRTSILHYRACLFLAKRKKKQCLFVSASPLRRLEKRELIPQRAAEANGKQEKLLLPRTEQAMSRCCRQCEGDVPTALIYGLLTDAHVVMFSSSIYCLYSKPTNIVHCRTLRLQYRDQFPSFSDRCRAYTTGFTVANLPILLIPVATRHLFFLLICADMCYYAQ